MSDALTYDDAIRLLDEHGNLLAKIQERYKPGSPQAAALGRLAFQYWESSIWLGSNKPLMLARVFRSRSAAWFNRFRCDAVDGPHRCRLHAGHAPDSEHVFE